MADNISNNSLYPVIGYVEPNSSAEKSGLMQPSDRIISINGRSLENLTIDEARQIIKESGSKLVLEIEFDVAGMRLKCLIFSK
jgi:C-terminal processing protease CtpA/Prc